MCCLCCPRCFEWTLLLRNVDLSKLSCHVIQLRFVCFTVLHCHCEFSVKSLTWLNTTHMPFLSSEYHENITTSKNSTVFVKYYTCMWTHVTKSVKSSHKITRSQDPTWGSCTFIAPPCCCSNICRNRNAKCQATVICMSVYTARSHFCTFMFPI